MTVPSLQPHEWQIGVLGFRLAPPRLVGGRNHVVEPIEFLSPQISSTAELTYTDINRKREVAFAMDDLSGGLADRLRFSLENQRKFRYAKHVDTSFAGYTLPGPKVETVGAAIADKPDLAVQRGSVFYLAAGAKLYQVASATSTPALDTTFTDTITALYIWDGNLLVGLGDATNFRYRAGDVSASAFTDAGVKARYFVTIGDTLYRAVRANTLSLAQAVGGPWADYDVGDSSFNITSLGALDQLVLLGKEDGLYGFDADFIAVPITPELRLQADAQVGKAAAAFNRDYYFTSRLGMVRVRPGEGLKSLGLDTLADPALPSNETRPARFTSDGRFLYALVVSGAGVYIWKHSIAEAWHNYVYRSDLGAAADLLYATNKIGSTSVNAVVFAYASGANWQLAYARFPASADPTKDTAYQFETAVSGRLRTLEYVASYPTIEKYSDRHKIVADDLASTRKILVDAFVDNDAAKRIGEFQKSPFGVQTLKDPLTFERLSLEFIISSQAATAPKFRAFHLSAALLANVVRRHTCHFLASSAMPLAMGGRSMSDYKQIVDRLRDIAAKRQAQKCRDEDGREFTAYLEDITETTAEDRAAPGSTPLKIVTAILNEVAT